MQGEGHSENPEQHAAIRRITAPQLATVAAPGESAAPATRSSKSSRGASNPDLYVISPNFKCQALTHII